MDSLSLKLAFDADSNGCPLLARPRLGLIAEHLHDHLPDSVFYGEDELPAGYDLDQIAAVAFGGVGALLRYVQALEARIERLEASQAVGSGS